jgi:hypothetical protein
MGEAARFPQTSGAPIWVGYVEGIASGFGSFPSGSGIVTDATLDKPGSLSLSVTDAVIDDQSPVFKEGYTYHFAASFLHDGYQEGPITPIGSFESLGYSSLTLDVIWGVSGPNPRVTDLIVYVVEDPGNNDSLPSSLPLRFVERVPVTSHNEWTSSAAGGKTVIASNPASASDNVTNANPSPQADTYSNSNVPDIQAVEVGGSIEVSVSLSDGRTARAEAKVELRVLSSGTIVERRTRSEVLSINESTSQFTVDSFTLRAENFSTGSYTVEVEARIDVKANPGSNGDASARAKARAAEVRKYDESQSGEGHTLKWDGGSPESFISGQTYQDRTGIERAVAADSIGEYQYAASAGAYRVIGGPSIDARISKETTNSAYVMRSKAYRPDMFDWATDIAQVGVDIQGIATSEQRVFVFCRTHTYVLDLEQFAVVDRLENVTAFNSRAATTTPQGLVFCDSNGVYLYQGEQGYRVLSDSIMEVTLGDPSVPQYKGTVTESSFTSLGYDADRQMLVLRYSSGGWGMYLPLPSSREQRPNPHWVHLTTDVVGDGGHPYAWTGDLYVADGTLHRLFDGGETGWTWITGLLAPQGMTRETTFYRADVMGDLSGTDIYYREDEQTWQGPVATTGGGTSDHPDQATVNSAPSPPWGRATRLELRFEGSGSDQLRGIGLVHRPQRGAADT